MFARDASLDTLLELNGQVFVIDEAGYWVSFRVRQVPATVEKPHGLDYSLTLHSPDNDRLVGFDNAHAVKGTPGRRRDHRHRVRRVHPYIYTGAAALVADFWTEVDFVMRERGVWR